MPDNDFVPIAPAIQEQLQLGAKARIDLEQAQADIDERDATISSLNQDLDFQTKAAFANQAEGNRLLEANKTFFGENHNLREQLNRANTERQTLAAELAGALDERDHATAAARQLQADLDATAHAADRARADLAAMSEQLNRAQDRWRKTARDLVNTRAELASTTATEQTLTAELRQTRQKLAGGLGSSRRAQDERDRRIRAGAIREAIGAVAAHGGLDGAGWMRELERFAQVVEAEDPEALIDERRAQEPSPTHVWSEQRRDWMPLAGPVSPGGCERCERPIQPGEPFVPPLPGVGLVEHVQCPGPVNEEERPEDAVRRCAGELERLSAGLTELGINVTGPLGTAAVDSALTALARRQSVVDAGAVNPWTDDDAGYDDWLNDLMMNTPDSWDDDAAAEQIVSEYVHELERRLLAAGGSLERWPVDDEETAAGPARPAANLRTLAEVRGPGPGLPQVLAERLAQADVDDPEGTSRP